MNRRAFFLVGLLLLALFSARVTCAEAGWVPEGKERGDVDLTKMLTSLAAEEPQVESKGIYTILKDMTGSLIAYFYHFLTILNWVGTILRLPYTLFLWIHPYVSYLSGYLGMGVWFGIVVLYAFGIAYSVEFIQARLITILTLSIIVFTGYCLRKELLSPLLKSKYYVRYI